MDFDTIIAILFILFFAVPQVLKTLMPKRKPGSSADSGKENDRKNRKQGFWDVLSEIASDGKKEFNTAMKGIQPEQPPSAWQQVMPPAPEKKSKPEPERKISSDYEARLAKVLKKEPPSEEPVQKKEPPCKSDTSPIKSHSYNVRNLRRAVVWSEVLAPPLALRNENEKL